VQGLGPARVLDGTELLERSGQLSALERELAVVSERSRGRLVLVRGEAGIGKTALLRRFCDELARSVRVLWAACDPLFTPRPLGPLLDVARLTEGELRARVESGAKPHDVAVSLLGELEAPAPTVLVLEDIHWADEATLDVVRLIGRRVEAVPALLLASYRDDQLDRSHPLRIVLGELPSGGPVTRLELARLSRASVAKLAEGSTIDADELYERTAGNPFFVTEALAAQTERVPATVRDAVSARAARLSELGRAVLDAVAVVPQRAEVWLLEALTDGSLAGLDECLGSGMLRAEADGVAFRHELARLAVEESIAPDRAVALHRRAVAALAEPAVGAPDLARLAHHAEAAGDADAVLRFAPAAAAYAVSVGAPREAQNQYARALRFAKGIALERRADLLERFADQGYLTDMRQEAVDALDEALLIHRGRGDLLRQGTVLSKRAALVDGMGRRVEARDGAREAVAVLEQVPPGPQLARACAILSGVLMVADDSDATIAWGSRAIALAERFDDTEALIVSLNNVGGDRTRTWHIRRSGEARAQPRAALRAGLGADAGRAYINLSDTLGRLRRWTDAERFIDPGIEYCHEHGLEAWLKYLVAVKARSELSQGHWDDAAETAASILEGPEGRGSGTPARGVVGACAGARPARRSGLQAFAR
jgi:tetratricopeptide (TPR) repeat protein